MLMHPQVFPIFNCIYPWTPQEVPHEFLTHQKASLYPTAKTPWFKLVEQLEKIPDL